MTPPIVMCYGLVSIVLISLFTSVRLDDCYCLKTELSGLRGALHIEPVNIDGTSVYLIAEQIGMIHKYNPAGTGTKLSPYLNLTGLVELDANRFYEQRGLLGFAPHSDFTANHILYVYSTRRINSKEYVVISEIPGTDVQAEKMLLLIEQPGDVRKGGQLLFGLDGYLYVFTGDGQNETATTSDAQDGSGLLGKVLRLDVNRLTVADYKLQYYDIPTDNPNNTGWRPEIYAMGFRNPWRCTIDKGESRGRLFCGDLGDAMSDEIDIIESGGESRGRLFCGDLGDAMSDEIDIIESGGNYGYPYKEGTTCLVNQTLCDNIQNEGVPIFTTQRNTGPITALILGPYYRGMMFTDRQRQLILADYIAGDLYSLEETVAVDNSSAWSLHNFTECAAAQCGCEYRSQRLQFLLSIGTTNTGELMLLMTDSLQPSDAKTVLLSLSKPDSSTPTCGGTSLNINSMFTLFLVLGSVGHYMRRA